MSVAHVNKETCASLTFKCGKKLFFFFLFTNIKEKQFFLFRKENMVFMLMFLTIVLGSKNGWMLTKVPNLPDENICLG